MRSLLILSALLIGPAQAADAPSIAITSPKEGETVPPVVSVAFTVSNLQLVPLSAGTPPASGHIHVKVDDNAWVWLHASTEPILIGGMTPGAHKVRLELAGTNHGPLDAKTVTFTVAAPKAK